jgi:hypothetical protein
MARRSPQTMAKREREQAVRERRERKQAKKAEAVAARAAAKGEPAGDPGDGEAAVPGAAPAQPPPDASP